MNDMRHFMTLLESTGVWFLDADPSDVVDDVLNAKIMTGEDLGADEDEAMENTLHEIAEAQSELKHYVHGNRMTIYRAITVKPGWVENLQPGAKLGVCWAFDVRGAYPYNGGSEKDTVIVTAEVDLDDIAWDLTLALHSSGEGEIRVARGARLKLVQMALGGHRSRFAADQYKPVRPDLIGEEFVA